MVKKAGRPLSADWVSTSVAISELGISRGHLFNLKNDGTFKVGKDFRDVRRSSGMRATYKWHLPNLQKTLSLGPEFR
ncbi:hypothetical protein [Microcoleus sp. CAWBG58]|uniref:hypothetical protein n=1 Tax=Microcoleus sp. CAWBG58 TaxID=2841651 RepID=UPI0025E8EE2D|nr:hypothetical protein [Microcoleus sp. CAWBG58]